MRNIIREFPDSIYRLAILFWLALAPALLAASTLPDDTPVGTCVLMPLETVLTLPAVNTDTWRSPEDAYRRDRVPFHQTAPHAAVAGYADIERGVS
jgi:hypothetical protein